MEIRYSTGPRDVMHYTTDQLRSEFLIKGLYVPDEVVVVYSHVDRAVVFGIMPVKETVPLDKDMDIWHNFGTRSILERREVGFFNIGAPGTCFVDGVEYKMANKDCIYITQGSKEVLFRSDDEGTPAKFYGVSYPAHTRYETRLLRIDGAVKTPLGDQKFSNRRVINKFIHPDVLQTCQLSMGLTILDEGNVWNTMPVHTHERRMEVYTYFDMGREDVVFHLMGEPTETRHLVVKNEEAVISPSYSIHSGCGTASYAFIWAMGGENKEFNDMDNFPTPELK